MTARCSCVNLEHEKPRRCENTATKRCQGCGGVVCSGCAKDHHPLHGAMKRVRL